MYKMFSKEIKSRYRKNTKSLWIEYNASSIDEVIKKYVEDYLKVYDADNGGDISSDIAICGVDTNVTKYFRVNYSWYIETDPEWELVDEYYYFEIPKEEAKGIVGDRDWMLVGSWNFTTI